MAHANAPVPVHRHDQPTAGRFRVEVDEGYPAWCRYFVDDKLVATLHHRDLQDLSYITSRAKDVAREKLGRDGYREV